ncbi:MAG TPA: hypothetical protein VF621_15385, partial [Pyrinomonadaceae bacterium]
MTANSASTSTPPSPRLADGVFDDEGVVGDLHEVVVARLLAGLEVPDAQPRPAPRGRGREHFEQVGARRPERDAPGVEPEAFEQSRLLPGVEDDFELRDEARETFAPEGRGERVEGEHLDAAAALVALDARGQHGVAVLGDELFDQVALEEVARLHQQCDAGAGVCAHLLRDVPADAGP